MIRPLILDLSRQWGWMDLWPADAAWNGFDGNLWGAVIPLAILAAFVVAIKVRKK